MADTVKLPGFGAVKKPYVWGSLAIVTLIVGVAWYRHSRSAGAGASAATAAASGTTPAAPVDPETGYPEGSPQDLAALQSLEGSYGLTGAGASDIGDTGTGAAGELYYDPADGLYDLTAPYQAGTGATSSTANTGPGTFTDNAYWTQYAIENVQGYSAADIQNALALYLSGAALSTTQMSIYQAAVAVAGPAPDPPATAPHLSGGGAGTGTPGGTVTVPAMAGDRVEDANSALQALGLHSTLSATRKPKIAYYVTAQSPKAGAKVAVGSNVALTISANRPKA
jgi:hypothetical protein